MPCRGSLQLQPGYRPRKFLAGVRRRRRKGRLRMAKAQTTALGVLRARASLRQALGATAGPLPACGRPGLILHPAMSPGHPPMPSPTLSAPQLGGDVPVPTMLTSHPSPSRTVPDQATLLKWHSPTLHLGSELGKGCFFPSLGKGGDFKGSLLPHCQPQVQPGVKPHLLLPKSAWVIPRHIEPCSDINPFPHEIKRKAG